VQHDVERRTSPIFATAGVPHEWLYKVGDQVDTICAVAAQRHTDLIVLGSRGLSKWRALLLGSVSDGVLLYASCPVLILHGKYTGLNKILLPVDESRGAQHAITTAIKLTQEFGSDLTALNIYEPLTSHLHVPPDELDSDSYLWRVRAAVLALIQAEAEPAGVTYAFDQVIVHQARENHTDLIVMGSQGSGTSKRERIGGVARQVAHHAHCPVLFTR
jgi:nucleotide-binding universal stress UspA family protein